MDNFYLRKMSDVGTENPIVARLGVQTFQLLEPFNLDKEFQDDIYEVLGINVCNRLIYCYKIYWTLLDEIIKLDKEVSEQKNKKQSNVIQIPTIIGLNDYCESFLYQAKSSLRDLCGLFKLFYGKVFDEPRFDEVHKWAEKEFGSGNKLTKLLKSDHDTWIRRVISMRNAIEHPGGRAGKLAIKNIEVAPNNRFIEPKWKLNDEEDSSILRDMDTTIINILEFSEDILVIFLEGLDHDLPIRFTKIPESEIDVKCPIRIRVSIDPKHFGGNT